MRSAPVEMTENVPGGPPQTKILATPLHAYEEQVMGSRQIPGVAHVHVGAVVFAFCNSRTLVLQPLCIVLYRLTGLTYFSGTLHSLVRFHISSFCTLS